MPKKYPLEFKKQAIRRYEKGESIPALCQELHVSQSTFYHWRNQYRSIQTSAHTYTPAEFDALVRRLQKAEHKLSIIQLSGYLSKVPLQDKLATLEHFHNEMSDLYSVHELCEALDVSRGTFYNHIFRRADRSKYESEKAQLMLKVKQIFDDSEQRYGADKIRAVLAETVCASVQNESCPLCRSLACTVFAPTRKGSTRTKCEKSKICSIENLPRITQIKYG